MRRPVLPRLILISASLALLSGLACDGFSFSFSFIVPHKAQSTEVQNVDIPIGVGLVVNNDNGTTRVRVDAGVTQARIEITKIALAGSDEDAEALLAEIVVTIQPPDVESQNLRITAVKPASATGTQGEFEVDFSGDELSIVGIQTSKMVAIVNLFITLPLGRTVNVHQKIGAILTSDLDAESMLETDHGSIHAIRGSANHVIRSESGSVLLESHDGNADVETGNGLIQSDLGDGNLLLRTANGAIQVDDHNGSIDAETGNGSINIRLAGLPNGGQVLAETINGRIDLRMPTTVNADLDARVVNGFVDFDAGDFDVVVPITTTLKHIVATLNAGGSTVNLRTTNGHIEIDGI